MVHDKRISLVTKRKNIATDKSMNTMRDEQINRLEEAKRMNSREEAKRVNP